MSPSVSVILLHSGQRNHHLARALTAIYAQRHRADQVIVVSDHPRPLDLRVHWVHVHGTNVAGSRNAGLAIATGDLVAFCDDDAAAEPGWIASLLPSFDNPRVGAAGGPVRGPDGIRIQWGETRFDTDGIDRVDGAYVKLNGTNMMLRRKALSELGGFDPRFGYYLDETDYLLRMEAAGWRSVWVDMAEMHHASAPNAIRGATANAVGFHQMGRSLALFCTKHLPETLHDAAKKQFARQQRDRLARRFQLGRLEARDIDQLHTALQAGMSDASSRICDVRTYRVFPPAHTPPERARAALKIVIAPRMLTRRTGRELADRLCRDGHEVTLIEWRFLRLPRAVRLNQNGVWHHIGGLYARANAIGCGTAPCAGNCSVSPCNAAPM